MPICLGCFAQFSVRGLRNHWRQSTNPQCQNRFAELSAVQQSRAETQAGAKPSALPQQDFFGEYHQEDFTIQDSPLIEQDDEPMVVENFEDAMDVERGAEEEEIVAEMDESDLESNIDIFEYVHFNPTVRTLLMSF